MEEQHLKAEQEERELSDAAEQTNKLKKAIAAAYEFCGDEVSTVHIVTAARSLVQLLRESLQVKLVTEQTEAVQEARALIQELAAQCRENADSVVTQTMQQDSEARKRLAKKIRVSPALQHAEDEAAAGRVHQRKECGKAVADMEGIMKLVPPRKTLHGEGWGWIATKWLKEVGVHLFGHVEREQAAAADAAATSVAASED